MGIEGAVAVRYISMQNMGEVQGMEQRTLFDLLPPVLDLRSLVGLIVNRHYQSATTVDGPALTTGQLRDDLLPIAFVADQVDQRYVDDRMDQFQRTPRKPSILVGEKNVIHVRQMVRIRAFDTPKMTILECGCDVRDDRAEIQVIGKVPIEIACVL